MPRHQPLPPGLGPPPSGLLSAARQWNQTAGANPRVEMNRRLAMARTPGQPSIGPTPSLLSRIGSRLRGIPRRAEGILEPDTPAEWGGLLSASMAEPAGTALDVADIGIGIRDLDPFRIGTGAVGAMLGPFASGPAVRAGAGAVKEGVQGIIEGVGRRARALGEADVPEVSPRTGSAHREATIRETAGMRNRTAIARTEVEVRGGLLPHELANFDKLKPKVREAFLRAYLRSPSPRELASLTLRGASQRGWYEASGRTLVEVFGDDAPRFAALLASTSPKASVANNLEIAMNIWRPWKEAVDAGTPSTPAMIRAIIEAQDKKVIPAAINNSITALTADGARLLDTDLMASGGLLSGPKVDPFWGNLVGEVQRTVRDTHMARGFGVMPGTVSTVARGGAMGASMQNAAKEIYRLTGIQLTGREVQEMTWGQIRAMTEVGSGRGGGAVRALRESPEAIANMADDTPSFATLLSDPKYGDAIRSLNLSPPVGSGAARGLDGFDPSLIRPEDLDQIAQRIDVIKEAERRLARRAEFGDMRKVRNAEGGWVNPPLTGQSSSVADYRSIPSPNPIYGLLGASLGAGAVRQGVSRADPERR